MATETRSARVPEVIAPGSGHHLHFLNHLATIKVRAGAQGALSAVEFTASRGFGPPLHRHDDEDELFLVQEGELAFHTADQVISGVPGAVALLPQGQPHTFQVLSETARFICVTASRMGVPRFDEMVASLGIPTDEPVLPEPGYLDATHIADVCLRHGIEIVGPPPPSRCRDLPARARRRAARQPPLRRPATWPGDPSDHERKGPPMTATTVNRTVTSIFAAALLLALMVAPAAAHTLKVHHPNSGEQIQTHRSAQFDFYNDMLGGGWVGGPVGLPGQGKGLVPGGPGGDALMTPSHDSGLNTSCESLEANPSAADIRGPGPSCPHGQ